MKTKIFGGIALMAIAAAVAFNVSLNLNKSNNQLSQLALANVEALAGDLEQVTVTCGRTEGKCWDALGMLKYCGEQSYNVCVRTEFTSNSCKAPC